MKEAPSICTFCNCSREHWLMKWPRRCHRNSQSAGLFCFLRERLPLLMCSPHFNDATLLTTHELLRSTIIRRGAFV